MMVGRTVKNQTGKPVRKTFKWTPEMRIGMAEYIRANYASYKKALGTQRKIEFLRIMRDVLGITADDKQMRNGFQFMLAKYEDVKRKLNSSGFGIDPEKDKSLDKGWILKACPYFDTLDEVMGTRPNVRPPAIVSTSIGAVLPETDNEKQCAAETGPALMNTDDELLDIPDPIGDEVVDRDDGANTSIDNLGEMDEPTDGNENSQPDKGEIESQEDASTTHEYVRQALHGMKTKKDSLSMKTPLGVFANVMSQKIEENVQVEREKMKIQADHYEEECKIQKEKNDIEKFKVQSQIDLEQRRLDIEEKRIAERKEERQHELEKLKMEQEFQLKLLKLQTELKK